MVLTLGSYLQQHHRASLDELARHFDVSAAALEGMLEHWLVRGNVKKWTKQACGGCKICSPEQMEIYQWIDTDTITLCSPDDG